jgi:anti-anti-sigma factor
MNATVRPALDPLDDYEEAAIGLQLTVSLGRRGGVVIARGDLDAATAPTLAETVDRLLVEPAVHRVVLDLTDLRFVDLAGIRQVEAIGRKHAEDAPISVVLGRALTRVSKLISGPPR